jgi:enoyl-CoA hydratase/carnithine racemase
VSRKGYRPNLRELGLFDWVVNTVGVGVALEMLLTGEAISAERAR